MIQCGDNRFEIIEKAKQALLNSTNIDSSPEELKVLDNILFRCWQMGWLNKYDDPIKKWHKFDEVRPPVGVEVIAYHHKWINEDFNPTGCRVGFLNDEDDFTSAYWWDIQDDYIGLAHWKCDDEPEFDHNSDNIKYIDPEYWTEITKFPTNEEK